MPQPSPTNPTLLSRLIPRPDAPLPLWMIFPVIFAALYLTHLTLLRLPYYWDEAGYYIPAAWDFFRTGSLIPITTLTNAHPPLPSVYLALWWRLCGFHPAVTREAVLIVASTGLLAVWKLALRLNPSHLVAFWTLVLTALYPIWFAQSTLAHADIFAAAATLWALVYALPDEARKLEGKQGIRTLWLAALWFSLAALAKETAIITPLTLAAFELTAGFRKTKPIRRRSYLLAASYCVCLLPLAAWYAYHRAKTGFLFGNAEFLQYNATSNLEPLRILAAFGHRLLHLFGHMNMFVPVLCTAAAMALDPVKPDPRKDPSGESPARISFPAQARIYAVLLANALAFSVLGGALLTRYLLPMFPLILLVCVAIWQRRFYRWEGLAALSAAALLAGIWINPPYAFAPEDNLTYRDFIVLHQRAVSMIVQRWPQATVLTAWPAVSELERPELGYTKVPIKAFPIQSFSIDQIMKAAANPGDYDTALLFSTKWAPAPGRIDIARHNAPADARYFDFHEDVRPAEAAAILHGELVWQASTRGEWVAILRFPRVVDAGLVLPLQ